MARITAIVYNMASVLLFWFSFRRGGDPTRGPLPTLRFPMKGRAVRCEPSEVCGKGLQNESAKGMEE